MTLCEFYYFFLFSICKCFNCGRNYEKRILDGLQAMDLPHGKVKKKVTTPAFSSPIILLGHYFIKSFSWYCITIDELKTVVSMQRIPLPNQTSCGMFKCGQVVILVLLSQGDEIDANQFTFDNFYQLYVKVCPRQDFDRIFTKWWVKQCRPSYLYKPLVPGYLGDPWYQVTTVTLWARDN